MIDFLTNYDTIAQRGDRMTMRELAKEAGVSVGTVSKAFRQSDEISEPTRIRIFEIAKKNGCFYKYYKEKHDNKRVLILCPEIKSAHYSYHIEYIAGQLTRRGVDVTIVFDEFDPIKQERLLCSQAAMVDGILTYSHILSLPKGIDIPIVGIGGKQAGATMDVVNINMEKAMMQAVSCLYNLGHRHIAYIGEKYASGRRNTFCKVMQKQGLAVENVIESDQRFEAAGEYGIAKLCEETSKATAIFCAYDNIAIGAIRALKERGLRVPEDISIGGMDNIPATEQLDRTLTTINVSPQAACDIACDLLIRKMNNKYYCAGARIEIDSIFIERETTGPIRTGG